MRLRSTIIVTIIASVISILGNVGCDFLQQHPKVPGAVTDIAACVLEHPSMDPAVLLKDCGPILVADLSELLAQKDVARRARLHRVAAGKDAGE